MQALIKLTAAFWIGSMGLPSAQATTELADPTQPPAMAASPQRSVAQPGSLLRLQAIFSRGKAPQALINDRLVKVGQRTTQFKVLKITDTRVLIERANGQASELVLTANIKDEL